MPRPPAPPSPERYLHAWRANDPAWLIHGGWDTLGFLNLKLRESFSGYALDMSGAGPALLALPVKAADGRPTLSLNTGTLRFYVAPDWSSVGLGGGPGGEARLIEFGAWSAQGQQTLCWLGVDGLGSTIRLVVNGATGPVEILAAPIQWAAGEWHQVALTWASGAPTMLYLDGRLAIAAGVGLDLSALESRYIGTGTPGFCVGSDGQGNRLAQGQFEEVYTFSRACTAEELAWNWQVQAKLAARGPISEEEAKALLESVAQLRSMPQPEPDGMSLAGLLWGGLPCLLWLEIDWSPATPGDVIVTLHNTIPGETYKLFSKTDLNLADWTLEETLPGAGGQNWTQTLRPIGQNPARFFTAEGPAEDLPDTSFPGLTLEDTGRDPPDTMGAVGPNHFVELLNGMIAVYNKTGQLVAGPEDTTHFFRVAGMNFPTGEYMVDPRVVYDQQSNRWVACAADLKFGGTYDVGLAVSTDSDPKPLLDENKWKKYHLDFYTGTGAAPDFPTLGVDANGIYICANYRGEFRNQVVAIDKAKLYGDPPELVTNIFDIPSSNHWRVIQPAVNFDPTPLGNLVWLIAKGPPQTSGNYQGGALLYRRLQWSNGSVDWKQEDRTDWHEVPEDPTLYRDYFDLDGADIGAPQKGGWTKIELGPAGYAVGSRLTMAVIRDQDLWTCHTIGLDGMDGDYSGNATGSTVDRSAVQWFRLHITTDGDLELQSVDDRGRIWDRRPSQPTHPSRVGGYDTSGSAYGVEVTSTSYAYVADGETGLQIINVYDPANPVRLGGYDTSGFAYDVAVFGYAYVADGDAGVQVINGYSDPSQPSRVGGYDTSGSARGLRVLGAYTYVADGEAGLQVIDVSNPASPLLVGSCDTSGFAYGVDVLGSYAYVADGLAGLQVIDVSAPADPERVGGSETSGCAYGVQVVGTYAYVADGSGEVLGSGGLQVIDISDPANPVRVGGYHRINSGSARSVHVVGPYAYLADEAAGLQVIDVCNPVHWYYFPSLMVNAAQDVVIGFSGSSCTNYIGAYYSWGRSPSCTAMKGPLLFKAGEDHFPHRGWGDYSYTSLDPGDLQDPNGLSIWTVQQYSRPALGPPYVFQWGTWIARIKPD